MIRVSGVGWRRLRGGAGYGAVLSVDFTLAKVRAQANFGDLAPQLPDRYTVWATDEAVWPASPGSPAAQLDDWLRRADQIDRPVRAVFGFCASASLATALAHRLAVGGAEPPVVVLFDPVRAGAHSLIDQAAASVRRIAVGAESGGDPTSRAAVSPEAAMLADLAPLDGDGSDLGALATALADRYAASAGELGTARSIPADIVGQLCRRVEANLRFLALCATAWSLQRANPDLVVLSNDHEIPAGLGDVPRLRLDVSQNALLSHPEAAGAAARALADRWRVPATGAPSRTLDQDTGDQPARQPDAADETRELNRKEEALWLFQRLFPQVAVDNLPLAVRTSAPLDPALLASATRLVLARYPALRTRFPGERGAPRREVLPPEAAVPPVEAVDVPSARLAETLTGLAMRPFDLTSQLPVRVHPVALREGGGVLCVVTHHIASDGASGGAVLSELATTYARLAADAQADVSPSAAPAELVESPPSSESRRYWREVLAGVDPGRLALSGARPEPADPTFAGARFEQQLDQRAQAAVRALRTRLRVTDNMVLLAAYFALLARHGAGPDLVVGVPVDLRGPGSRDAVGYHVSTLPLRVRVSLTSGFAHLAHAVRDQLVAGLSHTDVSFEDLLGDLRLASPSWRSPLFRHMFNFLPPTSLAAPGDLPGASWVTVEPGTSRHDLQFVVLRSARGIALQAAYSTEIHDEDYVRRLVDQYQRLITGAARQPDRPLAELDLWSEPERRMVAAVNAGAAAPVPAPSVPSLAARQAAERPAAPAVIEPDGRVHTHRALASRAARLRGLLSGAGVSRGDVVALALPRGADLAAAVLATWSLGAAYLPLDPAQPPSRRHDLLTRGGARVVVADRNLSGGAADGERSGPPLVVVPADPAAPDQQSDTAALISGLTGASPDDLAYVIFTSGSTGRPKGVEITHRALANLVRHFAHELATAAGDRVLWCTTFGFDISALEFALGLCYGGGLVAAPDEALVRPAVLLDLVSRHDVAVVQATPTIWRLVATELSDELRGRAVLCGGEPLSATLARRLLTSGCRLFNVYGPTETTIWSTATPITAEVTDPVGIGGPIAETALYVIDEYGQDAPPGVVGELCIAGTGLARGYAGAPELTAERFPVDPHRGRYYRTGDLATWRTDGTVTLLGRVDRQVKLRGRRIELGEIEAVLEQHPAVAAAAVVVAGNPQGDGRLVGYLQPAGEAADRLDLDEVRRHASATLPYFLLPAQLAVLPALPRNANGKVDYRALPEVTAPAAGGLGPMAPTDPLVSRLLALWRDLLGSTDLAADANFFVHGGHSLLAAILATRIGEELALPVSLLDVFHAPTPAALAALIRERTRREEVAEEGQGRPAAEVIT